MRTRFGVLVGLCLAMVACGRKQDRGDAVGKGARTAPGVSGKEIRLGVMTGTPYRLEMSNAIDWLAGTLETNDKGRLELDGERIRACQGHSLADMPVTREALEESWAVYEGTDLLWHGTALEALTSLPDLAVDSLDQVYMRAGPWLADNGLRIYRSPNGVVLVREVPVTCIVGARPGRASLASQVAAACREVGLPEGDPIGYAPSARAADLRR